MSENEHIISCVKERLGPIMLKMRHGNLIEDWYESTRDYIDDYKTEESKLIEAQKLNEICIKENWVEEAPNILIFSLPRL